MDSIVDLTRITEVFDHHPGFEAYWAQKIGANSHIEFIGAAATLIFEQWQQAGKVDNMSLASAQLLAAAILDNTLNFGASVTTDRDKSAYQLLAKHASLDEAWAANYFSECQQSIDADLAKALRNDSKFLTFANNHEELYVGQLVVWNAKTFITNDSQTIAAAMDKTQPKWFANIVGISESRSYFMSQDESIKQWLGALLGVTFQGDVAKASRLWLRKEIVKAAQKNSSATT